MSEWSKVEESSLAVIIEMGGLTLHLVAAVRAYLDAPSALGEVVLRKALDRAAKVTSEGLEGLVGVL